jgi:hypothetical protein
MAAFVASCLFFYSLKSQSLQEFVFFSAFIVLVEMTGRFLFKSLHEPNGWLYNLSVPIEYLFYGWIYFKNYRSASFKSLAGWFVVLFAAFSIINNCIQGLYEFHTNTLQIGSFFMIVLSLMFYVDIYKDSKPIILWRLPMFWIATGVLLFNAGEFSYDMLSEYLLNRGFDNQAAALFRSINNKLLLVLYGCLIVGFICTKITATSRKE